jgi:hypothetical protein
MEIVQAIESRHSVRQYIDRNLEENVIKALESEIVKCNKESGLNIQLVTDNAEAFDCFFGHYGKFENVKNFIALVGKKSKDLDEKLGYYGERLAILAQILGLNTCFVGLSYSKKKSNVKLEKGEKLRLVIALGYGQSSGVKHKSKAKERLVKIKKGVAVPEWFERGIELAMLAPTALNQQKFVITFDGKKADIHAKKGFYSKVDLGIVKYNFEVGAGSKNFKVKF